MFVWPCSKCFNDIPSVGAILKKSDQNRNQKQNSSTKMFYLAYTSPNVILLVHMQSRISNSKTTGTCATWFLKYTWKQLLFIVFLNSLLYINHCRDHSKCCNVIPYAITFIKLGQNMYIHNLYVNILETSYYIYCFLK